MHDRIEWRDWALLCEGAEMKAQAILNKRTTSRKRH